MYLKIRFCLAFFFGFAALNAQSPLTERITIEHGLSQGMIFDVLQTRDGFLWIATKAGLNRYDGYNFKVFSNNPFDPYSLAENTVTKLFEDSRGLLWVGTEGKGVDVYDPATGNFHHFELNFGRRNVKGIEFTVSWISEAADGSIYLLQHGNGLVRIVLPTVKEGKLPSIPTLSNEADITLFPPEQFKAPEEPDDIGFTALKTLPDGRVWVYTGMAAYQVLPDKGFVQVVDWSKERELHREVWGTLRNQLVRFRGADRFVLSSVDGASILRLSAKAISGGGYWISVNNNLWHLNPDEALDLSRPDWTLDARITAVTHDRNGNIWIGTQGYGLRKINPRKQLFHSGATGISIWGLWRSFEGDYFCKIVNEIYSYNPVSGTVAAQRAFGGGPKRVLDMSFAPNGDYWLLGRAESDDGDVEIRRYNPKNGQSRSYPFSKQLNINGKSQPFKVYPHARLIQTRDDKLLASGADCFLAQFDTRTGQYEYFDYAPVFKDKSETVRVFALAESPGGVWWIGTQQGLIKGIQVGRSRRFELMQATTGNAQGLNNNSIACLLPDPERPNEVLWIGTKGGGINRMEIGTGRVVHFSIEQGLPDNVVYGILPGQPHELWCSTNRGLARIRLDRQRMPQNITAFTAAQGLQDNEFNTQAFFKAANGELLFGGINGLNHFFPEKVLPDTTPPPVYLVGLRINQQDATEVLAAGKKLPALDLIKELKIRHNQNNLSFEFAVLDFTDPAKNRYRYRLVGADRRWVETGTYRFAHFTHLAPGRYTLLAEGSNGEGNWQPIRQPVYIVIRPPWWRSWPAYACYFLLIAILVWQAYLFQVQRVKEREQLAFEHREAERIRALEQMKTNFFSNVTHEFRTPLTLIMEPLRQLLQNPEASDRQEKVRLAENNSRKLLGLVNQLLDMAKLESGAMSLDLRGTDPCKVIRDVFESFLPLAEKRGIHMTLQDAPLREAARDALYLIDANKLELILNNLVSNALKFTPSGGQVVIQAGLNMKPAQLDISVGDTGIGIPAEALGKIFDRFYQVDGSHTRTGEGTGIGLALSKELAELMGGSINVESKPGRGSTFTFRMPLQPDHFVAETAEPVAHESPTIQKVASLHGEWPVVLVVEDNADLRKFIKNSIGATCQVVEASDGEEGLQKALELLPDLVISDVMMPRKDGYALCDELKSKELTAHIPVILLTAKSTMDAKLKGLRTGADDYLTKPFSTEELLARMYNLMTLRRNLIERLGKRPSDVPTDTADGLSAPDREFLKKFTLLIEQHLADETLGVEDFADKMYISRVQLHRKLKAITGSTATDFIKNYRLDRAHAMLRNREGMVGEIAMRVGFGNEKYFATVFKEKFGLPPSQV
jgi:signal transduction histidine kinase/DNA-binding response OmpR family regulator/ligand-binding sensor domain-containing protein